MLVIGRRDRLWEFEATLSGFRGPLEVVTRALPFAFIAQAIGLPAFPKHRKKGVGVSRPLQSLRFMLRRIGFGRLAATEVAATVAAFGLRRLQEQDAPATGC